MAPPADTSPKPARLDAVDWMRGLAVVLMIYWHVHDAWVLPALKTSPAYGWTALLGGIPARLFLFLVGVSQGIGFEGGIRRGIASRDLRRRSVRRGLEILILAYLFRLQEWLLGGAGLAYLSDLLRVDVLNCIGACLILVGLVAAPRGGRPAWGPALAAAAAFIVLGPVVGPAHFPDALPGALTAYFGGSDRRLAAFPLFPWAAWPLLGVVVGHLWARASGTAAGQARAFLVTGLGGLAVFAAVVGLRRVAPGVDRFTLPAAQPMGPASFFYRLGLVGMIAALAWAVVRLTGRRHSPMQQLGRTSLFVYWVHVELCYGHLLGRLHGRLDMNEAAIGFLAMTIAMYGLSLARTRLWDPWWQQRSTRRAVAAGAAVGLVLLGVAAPARAGEMRPAGKVTIDNGVIYDALTFDEGGGRLGWLETDAKGTVRLKVGQPGGKGKVLAVDVSKFTVAPEKLFCVGGHFWVVANEGERKAAVVTPAGKIKTTIGPFGEGMLSTAKGKSFVTVTEGGSGGGHSWDITAYRPDGGVQAHKQLSVDASGHVVGIGGGQLAFIGFSNGYLQALVQKPGSYDRRADVRGPSQIAVLDVLTGKVGPGKALPNIPRFLNFNAKRAEKPGVLAFARLDDEAKGLEMVGPAEKLRPIDLPTKFSRYEPTSLQQEWAGGKLVISLTVDPLNADQVAAQKKGERSLHIFVVDPASARASQLGTIPLGETQQFTWAAGGSKIAVLKKTLANGGTEVEIFSR